MKKLTAIFFFTLFLCNTIGYRIVYFFAQQQSDVRFEAAIDKNIYNEADLITVKVPLSLPYQNDKTTFERVNGEISLNGKIYKYVKRKVCEGNLILLCLPDYNKMSLKKQKDDISKDNNNFAQNTGSKKQGNSKAGSFKSGLSDYDQMHGQSPAAGFVQPFISHNQIVFQSPLPAAPHATPGQPPELS